MFKKVTSPYLFLLLTVLVCVPACRNYHTLLPSNNSSVDTQQAPEIIDTRPIITIWIHGTRLTPSAIMHNFFYRKLGMHPITEYLPKYHLHAIANTLAQQGQAFNFENFYTFGWSGKLSFAERLSAAKELYGALEVLCHEYAQKTGQTPAIRLITHSHGGNVALNLAAVKDQHCPFAIDELILLACPVQTQTMHFIADELFKSIYAFYSPSDILQVIDPQGLYKNKLMGTSLFSQRTFATHKKLSHIKTISHKRGLMHIEFLSLKFLTHMPSALKEIQKLKKESDASSFVLHILPQSHTLFGSLFSPFKVYPQPL